jgi:hypothetical protein
MGAPVRGFGKAAKSLLDARKHVFRFARYTMQGDVLIEFLISLPSAGGSEISEPRISQMQRQDPCGTCLFFVDEREERPAYMR